MSLGRRIRSVLIVALLALPAVSSQAQQARLLPDPAADQTPRAQLERSLTALAHRQLLARKEAMARVTTPDVLEARRVSVRETFLRLIGGLPPARTPLQERVTGRRQGEGFTVENVAYESEDQEGLTLTGTLSGHMIQARLRRTALSEVPLRSRGFHWINEYPFNR